MGDTVKKSIEKWEIIVQKSDASGILPEIERFFKKIGNHEETRSNASRRLFGALIEHVSLENVVNLMEILKFLIKQSPSHIFSYFFAILFNKTLKLEKEKNYKIGEHLAKGFVLDTTLDFEVQPKNIDLIMNIVQQWIFFHYKGGLPVTPAFKGIVVDNVKFALNHVDATKYFMILDKMLGNSPNLAAVITKLKGGSSILKEVLKSILSHKITLNDTTRKEIINKSIPKYILTMLNVIKIDIKTFKSFDQEILKDLEKKVGKCPVFDFLLAFCRWNEEPSIKGLICVNDILTKMLTESKSIATSQVTIESCIIVAKCLKPIVETIEVHFDCNSFIILIKFTLNLIQILMYCDSETDRGWCDACKNTKRHITDVLLNIVASAFEKFGKQKELNTELVSKIVESLSYKLQTVDGLKCDAKNRLTENSLIRIYTLLSHDTMLENPKFTKYKVKLADLFKKYTETTTFGTLTYKHIFHMYTKVFTLQEFPEKHLLISALQILYETDHLIKKSRADQINKKRENVPKFQNWSILDIIHTAQELELGIAVPVFESKDIILLEMETIFHYTRNYEKNVKLFHDLCKITTDAVTLGHALFLFELDEHNKIEKKHLEHIAANLKKLQPKTMMSEFILGLIAMRNYTNEYNSCREVMKEIKFLQMGSTKEEQNKSFDFLKLEDEKSLIKFLEMGLEHFDMALNIASRDKYKGLEELYSCTKIRRSLDTIAIQFEQRTFYNRAMEAQYLSYTISKYKQDDIGILSSLSYFIENLDQFKKLPKTSLTIPKITQDIIDLFAKLLPDIDNLSLYKQAYIYSTHLSLASYYISEENYLIAIEILKSIHGPLHANTNEKHDSYFKILRFKSYVMHHKLLQKYPVSNMSSLTFIFFIMGELNDLVEYKDDFHVYMPNILFNLLDYVMWQQCARYESKSIEAYITLGFKVAAMKKMTLRCLQIYLCLTYNDLIGENLNDVENHLLRLDRMVGYESTKITQKPMSAVTPIKNSIYEGCLDRVGNPVVGSAVRREALQSPMPYIMSPPINVPISEFAKYMIQHERKCKCIHCGLPQVKVFAFVVGCYYARMLYLNENYEVAYNYYQEAVEYWGTLKSCVMEGSDETLTRNLISYSLYTHIHMYQCLMKMKKFEETKVICDSMKELLALKICDNKGILDEVNFLIENNRISDINVQQNKKIESFESFFANEDIQLHLSPSVTKLPEARPKTTIKKLPNSIPIFVDGPKSAKMSPAQKKRLFFSKNRKDTLDSPTVSNLCMDLGTFNKSARKCVSAKVTASSSRLKKTESDIPSSSKTQQETLTTVKRSTRNLNKENDVAKKPEPTPVKQPVLKKKQLKFSPTVNSPVEGTIVIDNTIVETPKTKTTRRGAPISKPKTVTVNKKTEIVTKEAENSVIVIDSDSDAVDASIELQRVKRHKTKTRANI